VKDIHETFVLLAKQQGILKTIEYMKSGVQMTNSLKMGIRHIAVNLARFIRWTINYVQLGHSLNYLQRIRTPSCLMTSNMEKHNRNSATEYESYTKIVNFRKHAGSRVMKTDFRK